MGKGFFWGNYPTRQEFLVGITEAQIAQADKVGFQWAWDDYLFGCNILDIGGLVIPGLVNYHKITFSEMTCVQRDHTLEPWREPIRLDMYMWSVDFPLPSATIIAPCLRLSCCAQQICHLQHLTHPACVLYWAAIIHEDNFGWWMHNHLITSQVEVLHESQGAQCHATRCFLSLRGHEPEDNIPKWKMCIRGRGCEREKTRAYFFVDNTKIKN